MTLHVAHHLGLLERGERAPDGVGSGYPFSHVSARMREADLLVGNLECVVSPSAMLATTRAPLRAPHSAIGVLKDAGVDLVSVANNHAADFGPSGFADMTRRLTAESLPFVGARALDSGPEEPFIREVRGLKIGVLGFYQRTLEGAVSDVARARPKVDFLVVFNHWGHEGVVEPMAMQRQLGRALIDAGVDVVVGTHAHVLQPEEWYKGRLIFYGLGNFVFSGMNIDEEHRTGGYLELTAGPRRLLERRLRRIRLDDVGAPRWLDPGPVEPARAAESEAPPL